jgi:hypothetical protein
MDADAGDEWLVHVKTPSMAAAGLDRGRLWSALIARKR